MTINGVFPSATANIQTCCQSSTILNELAGNSGHHSLRAVCFIPLASQQPAHSTLLLVTFLSVSAISCGGGSHGPVATTSSVSVNPSRSATGLHVYVHRFRLGRRLATHLPLESSPSPHRQLNSRTVAVVGGLSAQLSPQARWRCGSHVCHCHYGGDTNFLSSTSFIGHDKNVEYQTTLTLSASDALGDSTTIQVPVRGANRNAFDTGQKSTSI